MSANDPSSMSDQKCELCGMEQNYHGPTCMVGGSFAAPPGSAKHLELITELSIENRRYKTALERIAKWFDEFPPSGRTWLDGTEMRYSAAFGSNGERDYMRRVAAEALSPNGGANPTGGVE